MEPEAFDKEFLAEIDKQTGKTVAGFETWTKRMRELNQLAKDGKTDEVIAKGRAIEGMYPEYVETGNVYEFVADACLKKGDKACAIDELGRYSKIGGRDPETMKQYAKLLEEAGKKKDAVAALERMNYVYPARSGTARAAGQSVAGDGETRRRGSRVSGAGRAASGRQSGQPLQSCKGLQGRWPKRQSQRGSRHRARSRAGFQAGPKAAARSVRSRPTGE